MYEKKIQRAEPGLIVLVLDDSGSMAGNLAGTADPKHVWVDRYVGAILRELLARSTEMRGEVITVKPRFYVSTILYGSDVAMWPPGVSDPLDVEQVITTYSSSETGPSGLGLGGNLGGTDTLQAFEAAFEVVDAAVRSERFSGSFPPMVFHLSDGESQTDASAIAERIRATSTTDGNTLLLNALLDAGTKLSYSTPADFPGYVSPDEAGPDPTSVRMFQMSSKAPGTIRSNLIEDNIFPNFRDGASLYFDVRTKEMLKHVIQSVGSVGSR